MISTITTERVPIKMWLDHIEPGALQQAKDIANLPQAAHHVAIMPDCHQGYGMPVGGVLATRGVIIPNAVGVDIGCGMCALRTSLRNASQAELIKITEDIRRIIPVGFRHHKKPVTVDMLPAIRSRLPVVEREAGNSAFQLGTLGGGNHFIELQKGTDGYLWIMVHSGSRNLGKQVADHYYRKAVMMNENGQEKKKTPKQLAGLPLDSLEGQSYFKEMEYCVNFAYANRKHMMDAVSSVLSDHFPGIIFSEFINIAHNFANPENHFGEELIIHRKGATPARLGEPCIIPGSQGTSSFIATGKGNAESFESCSHGAGRVMGRKEAQSTLSLMEEKGKLDKKGIVHNVLRQKDLDEAAGAYKDINIVMANQKDLVDIRIELQPLAVVKG
jgi:tRNA-splicing ligase RtcB (3'-phosphate/5'-hydroxy nucleic acid ligase)